MLSNKFYDAFMETGVNVADEPTPIEEKETFTRAEVEQIIDSKIREVLESIKPTETPLESKINDSSTEPEELTE